MITVTKNIKITGPSDSEYLDFLLYSSNTCVQIDVITPSPEYRITGNSGTITVDFGFSNESCFSSIITLEVTNNDGCTQSSTFTLDNPCSTFAAQVVNGNNGGNPFSFAVTNSGGVPPYSITWSWDTSLFTAAQNSVMLTLNLIDTAIVPTATNIIANVVDGNGCESQAAFAYQFKIPTAQSKRGMIFCNPNPKEVSCGTVNGQSSQLQLVANTDDTTTIDWTTLEIVNDNSNLCYSHLGDGLVVIYSKDSGLSGDYTMTWSVENNLGIRSNSANINILAAFCQDLPEVVIHDIPRILDPADTGTGDITYIPIEDNIVVGTGRTIDWDDFTFVALTGQTLVSATQLTTQNGSAELTASRQIKYTVGGSIPLSVDIVAFTVEDDLDNVSNLGRTYIDFEASAAPAVPNQTRSVATFDSRRINLLTGATGSPLTNNILITDTPDNGAYTLGTDGYLTYSPRIETEGTDTIKYKVYNSEGVASSEITLSIDIIHAGGTNTISHCLGSNTVDLEAILSGTLTSGGTWAEDASNPSTGIGLGTPTAVSLSGSNEGLYLFTYTVVDDGQTTVGYASVNFSNYTATHLSTVDLTVGSDVQLVSRFQLNPKNIPLGNVRFQIHNGPAPLTPGSGNIVNELTPTAHESTNGIFELTLSTGLGNALPAISGNVYETRLKVTTPCGDIFYTVSGVEI